MRTESVQVSVALDVSSSVGQGHTSVQMSMLDGCKDTSPQRAMSVPESAREMCKERSLLQNWKPNPECAKKCQ